MAKENKKNLKMGNVTCLMHVPARAYGLARIKNERNLQRHFDLIITLHRGKKPKTHREKVGKKNPKLPNPLSSRLNLSLSLSIQSIQFNPIEAV